MFYALGLINDKEIKFNKNLLLLKFSVFSFLNSIFYGEKRRTLFPPLKDSSISNITNSLSSNGPIVCAADDLELSLEGNNEQIEFYNNFAQHSLPDTHSTESSTLGPIHEPMYGIGQQNVSNASNIHNQQMMLNLTQHTFQFDQYYNLNYKGVNVDNMTNINNLNSNLNSNATNFNSISHYNLNMFGLNNAPYFNDFGASKQTEINSYYSSSVDSTANPLDDELINKIKSRSDSQTQTQTEPQSKKRTFGDVSSTERNTSNASSFSDISGNAFYDIDHIFNDMLVKNESEFTFPPQQLKMITLVHGLIKMNKNSPLQFETVKKEENSTKKLKSEVLTGDKDSNFQFQCSYCDAKFKVKGYLTRHLKKHNSSKAFVCPFYQEPCDGNSSKCHPTGGFSRRDTYKTHLKALHFIYPPGTKSNKRNMISGRCAGCFKHFESNYQWLEEHIEPGECDGTVVYKRKIKEES